MIRITKPYKEDTVIPVSVFERDGEVTVDVYQEYYDVVSEYLKRFKNDLFSDEALCFLAQNIVPSGYKRESCENEFYYLYLSDTRAEVKENVLDIADAVYEYDETEFEADVIKEYDQPASVIISEGRIAAISACNYFIEDDDDEVELAVETLPEFRNRGYAKAVLSHMTNKVLDMGKTPVYRVSCFNDSSVATVRSCGYRCVGREYYLYFYKED